MRVPVETTQSLALNGTTQYAYIPNASQTGLGVGTGDFMLCCRVLIKGKGSQQAFADIHDTGHSSPNSAGGTGWSFIWNNNGTLSTQQGDGSTTNSSSIANSIFDGVFHDLALVSARNFGSGITQIWLDGLKLNNASGGPTGSWTSNGDFVIGAREDKSTQFLNGNIKNVHLYTWSKITNDYFHAIEDLHYLQTTSYTNGLVSKWLMNGNANDSVGSNNLTLVGSPSFATPAARSGV